MAFIYEPIPDADKQRIDFEKQAKDLSDFGNVPYEWLIDRERDIYLVSYANRSGHPEGRPSQFGFGYKNIGFVELRVIEKVDPDEPYGQIYDVLPIFWRNLEQYCNEMVPLIEEALIANHRNFYGYRKIPFTLTVNFQK